MQRWMAAPVALAAAAALAVTGDPRTATAQQAPSEESFLTADGVRLKGLFHRSPTPTNGNPVVMLLYPPGPGNTMTKGDWDGLAKTLNGKGYHVFRFDWRGHGKSTDITDTMLFWRNDITGPWNARYINGANKKPVKNDIKVKDDVKNHGAYFPVYVTDLAAARNHLDQMNDPAGGSQVNTGSIYLIGAGDAATLGMLWMAAEWNRPAVHPILPNGLTYKVVPTAGIINDPPAGADVAGAVWLTATHPSSVRQETIRRWPQTALKMRENNPMLFLYGDGDTRGKSQTSFFHDVALVAKGGGGVEKLADTFAVPVKGAKTLSGVALLGNNAQLKTEDSILDYLAARQKIRAGVASKPRNYPGPYFINLAYFGMAP